MSTAPPVRGLERGLRILHALEDGLLALLLGAMVLIAAAQILLRNLFEWNFAWGDPLTRLLVLWVGLLGALAATRDNRHISIDLLSHLLHGRVRAAVQSVTGLFAAAVCLLLAWHAARFVGAELETGTRGLAGLPTGLYMAILPLGFGLIGLRQGLQALAAALTAWRKPS